MTVLINMVPKLCSSFLHSETICLCSFIVTNYSGMEDRAPQLRLTGNFPEGLKIWISISTLCLGLNSEIQTWMKVGATFTLMYLYLFALCQHKQLLLFADRRRTVRGGSCAGDVWVSGSPLLRGWNCQNVGWSAHIGGVLILLCCHPASTQSHSVPKEQGWAPIRDGGGGHRGLGVLPVGSRSPDLILTLIRSHTHTRALSSTDLLSHPLASDMCVVISTWLTRCVFLCVCLAVSVEDIHKVY